MGDGSGWPWDSLNIYRRKYFQESAKVAQDMDCEGDPLLEGLGGLGDVLDGEDAGVHLHPEEPQSKDAKDLLEDKREELFQKLKAIGDVKSKASGSKDPMPLPSSVSLGGKKVNADLTEDGEVDEVWNQAAIKAASVALAAEDGGGDACA